MHAVSLRDIAVCDCVPHQDLSRETSIITAELSASYRDDSTAATAAPPHTHSCSMVHLLRVSRGQEAAGHHEPVPGLAGGSGSTMAPNPKASMAPNPKAGDGGGGGELELEWGVGECAEHECCDWGEGEGVACGAGEDEDGEPACHAGGGDEAGWGEPAAAGAGRGSRAGKRAQPLYTHGNYHHYYGTRHGVSGGVMDADPRLQVNACAQGGRGRAWLAGCLSGLPCAFGSIVIKRAYQSADK